MVAASWFTARWGDAFIIAAVFLIGGFNRRATEKNRQVIETTNRPAEDAYRAGYDCGYDEGWKDGRKTGRPTLVHIDTVRTTSERAEAN